MMKFENRILKIFLYLLTGLFSFQVTFASQPPSDIYHDLLKLKETKRVLYVAAHPDDENTRLIAYLANHEHAQVAYLSLTRGDGGQNLIGKELGIELGMIRTQELLRARETDGGRQFFSRAIDFGFSRNPDETLNNWDKDKLLSDVVWVIRKFQPDIIITRFNTIPGTTHGHHTTSAILAGEAYRKAADANVFPEQLELVQPWQAKRIFWNSYNWGGQYEPKEDKLYHQFAVGQFNPLLGTTYSKIAADSRTMHKSQGFGATAQIGEGNDFIELVEGEKFTKHPFEDIPNRWLDIDHGADIEEAIDKALGNFDFRNPSNSIKDLLAIKKNMELSPAKESWFLEKRKEIDEIIIDALGIQAEFLSKKELSYPSENILSTLVFNNPSEVSVLLKRFTVMDTNIEIAQNVLENKPYSRDIQITLPETYPISQPFWLNRPPQNNLFSIEEQTSIGPPFNMPAVSGLLSLDINGFLIRKEVPLKYKYNDQVDGEINQPFTLVPKISLDINKENVFVLNGKPETLEVVVTFEDKIEDGQLVLEGLADDEYQEINKVIEDGKKKITYNIRLSNIKTEGKSAISVKYITTDGKQYGKGIKRILYKHIPNLTYFPPAQFNLINLQLELTAQKIGYIPGAGDDIPEILSNLGYEVSMIDNGSYSFDKLSTYSTIIVGIRAFNVNQNLANNTDNLMKYVHEGGNLIVQYNTSSPLLSRELGPYPFELSRDRVTVEESPVEVDFNEHPALRSPNRIEISDFDDWIQERGLYFPGTWDNQYKTPLTMQDPNQSASKGSLLLANYGSGSYAYSGISWFRLLPAGVPGAIKIFVNLIEQASDNGKKQ